MIDTWKKRREDEEEYIPGAFGAARMGAQAMAQQQSRPASPAAAYRAPKTTQQKIADLDTRIADYTYQKFVESDDYASLVKRYSKQGLLAMDDTLGRVAARTGGIASSYATTAGQQAYGGYMSELEGIARDMYERDKAEMMDERERLYDMQRQERSDALDLYKLRIAADEEDYDRKNAMAKILAGYGDFSLYEELGLNKDQVGNMKAAYDKANAPAAAEQKPKLTAAQADAAIKEGITTPEVIAAYEYYYGVGALGNGGKLMMGGGADDGGEPLLDDSGNPVTANDGKTPVTTEDEALYKKVWDAVMSVDKSAVRDLYSGALLSPSQWAAEPQGYRDYKEYLTDFVREFVPDFEGFGSNAGQTGGTTGSTASAKYNEAKSFVDEIASRYGVDQVMEDFAEKPDELTEEEFRALWAYINSLQ